MTPSYWVEMTLSLVSGDHCCVEKLTELLDTRHEGELVYTFSRKTGLLSLGMSVRSDEIIDVIPGKVVGMVRTACHELGWSTPGWPEPVGMKDVHIAAIDQLSIKALAPAC